MSWLERPCKVARPATMHEAELCFYLINLLSDNVALQLILQPRANYSRKGTRVATARTVAAPPPPTI